MIATAELTRQYFVRHPLPIAPRVLGNTGLTVSPVGFGGYRVEDREPAHREALRLAIRSGCNLIDTSSNYGNGGSEFLIGQVLSEAFQSGELRREEIVVVTKAGYVQGDNLEIARAREEEGQAFPEMVKLSDDCWHCIHPEYLRDQLTRSLQRLALPAADVFLLHNPEYFLKRDSDHAEYYRRIREAFETLEDEADRGRIRFYGISSNTFPSPRDDAEFTSLESVLELAREVAKKRGRESRFAVIQLPLNLLEAGAVLEENNVDPKGRARSVLDLARENGLGVLINRPLNAFGPHGLIRLATFPDRGLDASVLRLENAFHAALAHEARYPGGSTVPAGQIAWAHILQKNFQKLAELDVWKTVLRNQIAPALFEAHADLAEKSEWRAWTSEHRRLMDELFSAMTETLEGKASENSKQLSRSLEKEAPALKTSPTLSRQAIRTYLAFDAVHCVLVGMRSPEYVRDALALDAPLDSLQALRVFHAAHTAAQTL